MDATSVRRAGAELERALDGLVVDDVPILVAADLVAAIAGWERRLGAVRVALGHRVARAGGHRASGDRDGASFLARVSGSSVGRARDELALADRLAKLPPVAEAVAEGRISQDQAKVLVPAAEADPGATPLLLAAAAKGSFAQLRSLSTRTLRAQRTEDDEVARERRVHARRYCRTWVPEEGGLRLDAWVGTVEGAKLLSVLEHKTAELLAASPEPAERLRADALVASCCGEKVRTEVRLQVDAAALVRGGVRPGEVCEVQGVGPVSVTAARSLLGEAFVTLLVTKGADLATVTSTTRVVPRAVRTALEARDRCCVVPGCGATHFLQIDHWRLDFARGGLTALDNLCRLCSVHHKMKTNGLLRLGGGPGRWYVRTVPRAGPP